MARSQLLLLLVGTTATFQITLCFPVVPPFGFRKHARRRTRASTTSSLLSSPGEIGSSSDLLHLLNSSSSPRLPADLATRLERLSELVCEWNEKINLVSRKDCTPQVVLERHILPSVAPLIVGTADTTTLHGPTLEDGESPRRLRAIDVGTGGGFPGLPLAIACPDVDFVLLDSVGKKLIAVQEMAVELGLHNVVTHHGRAEEYPVRLGFDVAFGRSV